VWWTRKKKEKVIKEAGELQSYVCVRWYCDSNDKWEAESQTGVNDQYFEECVQSCEDGKVLNDEQVVQELTSYSVDTVFIVFFFEY
jgi:hypothetical protein